MAKRITSSILLYCGCLTAFIAAGQKGDAGPPPIAAPQVAEQLPFGRPNAQFTDLLDGDLFNARFGPRTIPFGRQITIEVVEDAGSLDHFLEVVEDALSLDRFCRYSRRALVRALRVDGTVTDENRGFFYVANSDSSEPALVSKARYRLTGYIRHGFYVCGTSRYSFVLSEPPERIDPAATGNRYKNKRVSLTGQTLNRDGVAHVNTGAGEYRLLHISPWKESMLGKTVSVTGALVPETRTVDVVAFTFADLNELVDCEVEFVGKA